MFKQIMDGKILRLGYKKEVKQLLAAMTATYINKKPVSVLRLADYYFKSWKIKKIRTSTQFYFDLKLRKILIQKLQNQ